MKARGYLPFLLHPAGKPGVNGAGESASPENVQGRSIQINKWNSFHGAALYQRNLSGW